MLSISNPMQAGASAYYADYYQKHAKAQGYWLGSGANQLKLGQEVEPNQLESLLLGYHPRTHEPLVQNPGRADRQGAWDLTFSAPKSVSVLWSQLLKPERAMIERAHSEAVQEAIAFLENEAGFSRRGKGGKIVERAGLVFALFLDYTSRTLDPQLHTHALLFNVAVRWDGTTGTIRSQDFFERKMALGALYRDALAANLSENFGWELEPDQTSFRVKGVPESLCAELSKRRGQIEAELARIGKADAVSAKAAALKTRRTAPKAKVEELFEQWQRVGETHGFGRKEALELFQRGREQRSNRREEARFEKQEGQAKKPGHDAGRKPEKPVPSGWSGYQEAASAAKFLAGHFIHVRTYKATLPFDPRIWKGDFWRKKKIIIPYLQLGPNQQRWGFIRKRIYGGRFFEFRIQERILFPRTPTVLRFLDWRLPALRLVGRETLERDAEWAIRRGLLQAEKVVENNGKRFASRENLRNGWNEQGKSDGKETQDFEQKRWEEERKREEEERRRREEEQCRTSQSTSRSR